MPARKRVAEARRRAREQERAAIALDLERLARRESDPVRRREAETESAWADYEINRAAVRYGHCSCGFGRCCSCGSYGVDGPYCQDRDAKCD